MMQNALMQQPQDPQGQNALGAQPQGLPPNFNLDEAIQHADVVGNSMADLLGKPDLSGKDVLQTLVDLANKKIVTFQKAAELATQMPPDQGLKQWLQQHLMNNIQASKALNMHKVKQNAR